VLSSPPTLAPPPSGGFRQIFVRPLVVRPRVLPRSLVMYPQPPPPAEEVELTFNPSRRAAADNRSVAVAPDPPTGGGALI
jgi:hypothetical protein